jgi:8-oxo-dGTP pyrophosphatase MutT (NUDIX family)
MQASANATEYNISMAFALIIPQITGTKKIAFQRRDDQAPSDANLLGLFGGSIETGESPLEAAVRELAEETSLGVEAHNLALIAETTMPTQAGEANVHLFTVHIPDTHFEVYEGSGYECYTKTEFLQRADISRAAAHLLEHNPL